MAFKYENGKVIQVSPPHVTGKDAKKMLNAKDWVCVNLSYQKIIK